VTILDIRPVPGAAAPAPEHLAVIERGTEPATYAVSCLSPTCTTRIVIDDDLPAEVADALVAFHLDQVRGWTTRLDGLVCGQILDTTGDQITFRLLDYDTFGLHPLLNPRGLALGTCEGWPIP